MAFLSGRSHDFKCKEPAQTFLSPHAAVEKIFNCGGDLVSAGNYIFRAACLRAMAEPVLTEIGIMIVFSS